jgi:hypothetical protein
MEPLVDVLLYHCYNYSNIRPQIISFQLITSSEKMARLFSQSTANLSFLKDIRLKLISMSNYFHIYPFYNIILIHKIID